jgi:hypothetical protein
VGVGDHEAVGQGAGERVRFLLGQLAHVGDAHLRLGHLLQDGAGQGAAAVVAAAAAVELVLLLVFPDRVQHVGDGDVAEGRRRHRVGPPRPGDGGGGGRAGDRAPRVGAHIQLGGDGVARGALGPGDATAFAGQQLEEEGRARRAGVERLQQAGDGPQPADRQQAVIEVSARQEAADRPVHAALQRIEGAAAGRRVAGQIRQVGGFDAGDGEPAAQLFERQREAEALGVQVGVALLADAGADEEDVGALAVARLQLGRVGQHRRQDGREGRREGGVVAGDQLDGHGAGGGEEEPALGRLEQGRDRLGDELRSLGGLVDGGEAEAVERGRQLGGAYAGELGDERRRERGDHRDAAAQEGARARQVVAHQLGGVPAGAHAPAAEDAGLGRDGGVVVFDADRFDEAVSHAGVAVAALGVERVDGRVHGEGGARRWGRGG